MASIFHKDECVQLVSKHYYIQFSSANNQGNVQKAVEECVPIHLIEHKSMSKWIQLVSAAHLEVLFFCIKKKFKNLHKKNCHFVDDVQLLPGFSRQQEPESRRCERRTGGQSLSQMAP